MGDFLISPENLWSTVGSPEAPMLFDVCKCEDYDASNRLIPSARWRDPTRVAAWVHEVPSGVPVVVSCVKGLKVSQAVAAELRLIGRNAAALEGGNAGWQASGLPTIEKRLGVGNREQLPTRWVTRVRPKIDRIACPWLINRFIDPAARFFYVAADQVIAAAKELDAIPFDVDGVELTHRGELDSFDAILADFSLHDPALDRVATIVRGADTARLELAPEAAGLLAISLGISQLSGPDDHIALERGFGVYDALYAWARHAATETHNWPTTKTV